MSGFLERHPAKARQRPSVPGPGSTVAGLTEERAFYVRRSVAIIQDALSENAVSRGFYELFGSRWQFGELYKPIEPIPVRAAWALVSQRIVGRLAGAIGSDASLRDAEVWFGGGLTRALPSLANVLTSEIDREACRCLEAARYDSDFAELLPYILDVHGPGSRASVLRDPLTRKARKAKREGGVFYTPADVAEYQAKTISSDHGGGVLLLRCLDPACGTGVYLRAMLRVASTASRPIHKLGYVTQCLYGFDISAQAIEASCFVLLYDSMSEVLARSLAPWSAWHAIRLNFSCVDSLTVTPGGSADGERLCERMRIRSALLKGRMISHGQARAPAVCSDEPVMWVGVKRWGTPLSTIFPEGGDGFELLIGNPPYAPIGERSDASFLSTQFVSVSVPLSLKDDLYPLFIEMMWRLTRRGRSASSVVVPLSIAYHRGGQFERCRRAMIRGGGRWRCAFFDREPHALFGENVKIRNTILFRDESPRLKHLSEQAAVETSSMRRWTSRMRERLFSSIKFTDINGLDIRSGIPKLEGPVQVRAAVSLRKSSSRFVTFAEAIRSIPPAEALASTSSEHRVFVAGTAYNFLNVFREHRRQPSNRVPFSTSHLTAILLRQDHEAWEALAILSSRLVFWWWYVRCDGFHVPRWFIEDIPFDRDLFTPKQRDNLAECGERLWEKLQDHQINSVNRGRLTIAYRPLGCERERNEIDSILIQAAGLEKDFASDLRRFVREVVIIDETDIRRTAMRAHFEEEGHDRE